MISLVVNNRAIDLPQETQISIVYQLNVINRITDRSDDFSYSFNLPNSKENQNFFNSLFLINSEEYFSIKPFDTTSPEVWNENIDLYNYRHLELNPCRLYEDENIILEGFFRIKEINNTNNFIEYVCEIYGKTNPLIDEFRRLNLNEVINYDEIYCWTQPYYDIAQLENGNNGLFDTNAGYFNVNAKYCLPIINYGNINGYQDQTEIELFGDKYTRPAQIQMKYLRPAFFCKALFYKCFETVGYSIISDFWNDTELKPDGTYGDGRQMSRLVIPFTNDNFYVKYLNRDESPPVYEKAGIGESYKTIIIPAETYANTQSTSQIISDPLIFPSSACCNSNIPPCNPETSCTGIRLENFWVSIDFNSTATVPGQHVMILWLRKNGVNFKVLKDWTSVIIPIGVSNITEEILLDEIICCLDNNDTFDIILQNNIAVSTLTIDFKILHQAELKLYIPDNIHGYQWSLTDNLPNIKMWDFIKSLIVAFNLYIKLDVINKIAYVETRDTFYKGYQTLIEYTDVNYENSLVPIAGEKQELYYNWSNLVDRDLPIKQRLLIDEFKAFIDFEWNDDGNDWLLEDYADNNTLLYSNYEIPSANKNLYGNYIIKPNLFSPFIKEYLKYGHVNMYTPHFISDELKYPNYSIDFSTNYSIKLGYFQTQNYIVSPDENPYPTSIFPEPEVEYDRFWLYTGDCSEVGFDKTLWPTLLFSSSDFIVFAGNGGNKSLLGPSDTYNEYVPDPKFGLDWESLYYRYYFNEIQLYLNSRLVTFNIYLEAGVLVDIDLTKPVYIDNVYYYIYKIDKYSVNSKESTKVELIKIK